MQASVINKWWSLTPSVMEVSMTVEITVLPLTAHTLLASLQSDGSSITPALPRRTAAHSSLMPHINTTAITNTNSTRSSSSNYNYNKNNKTSTTPTPLTTTLMTSTTTLTTFTTRTTTATARQQQQEQQHPQLMIGLNRSCAAMMHQQQRGQA